jgi:KaiC/GvpD/RAD55 family RecA-like ATPase
VEVSTETVKKVRKREFIPTGIQGLDELLHGKGLPKGSITYLVGGPGTGKTTLSLQFLLEGAKKGELGVYISLDEGLESILDNAAELDIDVEALVDSGKINLVDASPIISVEGEISAHRYRRSAESSLAILMDRIGYAGRAPAQRLVIDSLATIVLQFPEAAERRMALKGMIETVRELKITTLLLSELSGTNVERMYNYEEFLADGTIVMRANTAGNTLQTFTVEKMRGVENDKRPHPYKIVKGRGIEVFPNELAEF